MRGRNSTTADVYGLFNDSFPPVLDGVTLTVENYCRWLINAGRRVCVVTPWNPVRPPHDDFHMHRYFSLPIYNRHPYRYGYPRLDPMIWRSIRREPLRLVHAHCPFSSGHLAAYAARYHRIPLITTFHSKYRTDLDRSLPQFMVRYQMRRMMRFYENATEVWIPQAAVEETIREYGYRGPLRVVENGNDFADGID
ncbi:MAG: glycosyltransferase, partial [Duncaniella sp.]|nr:glycosyltransferase [Duncaniella sp.]